MSVLVKKEIRLLFPGWVAAIILAITPVWLFSRVLGREEAPLFDLAYLVGTMLLGLSSFGQEFDFRTFSLLLAQPISRRRIWSIKLIILSAAYVSVLLAFFVSWELYAWCHHDFHFNFLNRLAKDIVAGLSILIGGLWTTLLLRQVAAAFWFTFLVPLLLVIMVSWFICHTGPMDSFLMLSCILLIYSVAGFAFACWLLRRAQDVQWSGGSIVIPEWRALAGFRFASGARRRWSPRMALLVKEFKLHQSQLVIAGVLFVLHIAVLIARKYVSLRDISPLGFVFMNFWTLWLVMPLLAGCVAVAEERKLGTFEAQWCLPAKWRMQFMAKAGVVLLLSLLLGSVMPLLLEGARILPDVHLFWAMHVEPNLWELMTPLQICLWYCLKAANQLVPLFMLCRIALAIGLISFYASTWSRNSLQALGYSVFGILFLRSFTVLNSEADYLQPYVYLPGNGGLNDLIGLPALTIALLFLASSNSRCLAFGTLQKLKNLLVLLMVLALVPVVTAAIMLVWEKID